MIKTVVKRNGQEAILDYEKIHKVISWACEGLKDVSVSEVATNAHLQLYDKITTTDIHNTLIKSAANLISEESPNYQFVAARLLLIYIRKEVYNQFEPYSLLQHIQKCTQSKKYDKAILESYSEEEISKIEKIVKHERDLDFTYAGLKEMLESYLVKDLDTKELLESPQYAYICIAMTIFLNEKKESRLSLIKELYDALTQFRISLPTPIMANCRTVLKTPTSCTLIDVGDGIESIFSSAHAVGKYVTRGAGIGLNMGRIRAEGSSVKNGLGFSTGNIPYYRLMESAINSCNQGRTRKGSGTLNFPFWHYEAESLIPLKSANGANDNRIRHVDYVVQLNKLFYDRIKANQNITLFCPSQVEDLYEAFFQDQIKFEELYLKYEKKRGIRKKVIKAKELLDLIVTVRAETGRLYIMNVDNCNEYGVFNSTNNADTVRMTNLCCFTKETKILLASKEAVSIGDLVEKGIKEVEVVTYDEEAASFTKKYTVDIFKTRKSSLLQLTFNFGNFVVKCTPDHKFLTERGWVEARDLGVGENSESFIHVDREFREYKNDMYLVGKEELLEEEYVYCMNVKDTHNFCLENGLVVKNCEITLPTNPIQSIDDKEGLVALCTLGAINLGKVKQLSDMELLAKIIVRALDNLIEDQPYPLPAAERFGREYRALGIGVSGLAHYLAKHKLKYANPETLPLVHQTFEAFQYYLLKASNELAKERGACKAFHTTKYSKEILPIDKYKKAVDEVCNESLHLDWEELRNNIKEFGLRNTTLSAQMPVEKSSVIGNSTNGIEAPRALVSIKNNKNSGNPAIVVPEIEKLKKYYQLTWDKDYSNKSYLDIACIIQKFMDQSISSDLYYSPENYYAKCNGDLELIKKELYKATVQDIFRAHRLGIKTLYYHTSMDNSSEKHEIEDYKESSVEQDDQEESCPGGSCTL